MNTHLCFLQLTILCSGNPDDDVPIEKIMKVIRNLKDDSVPEEESIFTIRPETLSQVSPNSRKKRFGFSKN